MARFEILVTRRTDAPASHPTPTRVVLGWFGAMLASIAVALLAVGVVFIALVLGYLIAGLVVAATIAAILAALLSGTFRRSRN